MIAAFDVHYMGEGRACAAAIVFAGYESSQPVAEYTERMPVPASYVPGRLYKRELPCILALAGRIREPLLEIVVDGYATLGNRPGLGQHLFRSLGERTPVIGVAKSPFRGAPAARVLRGRSSRPLFVTSAGMDLREARARIESMHGAHRLPALLKRADFLARSGASRRG
jgi:deoxyribonuclease V